LCHLPGDVFGGMRWADRQHNLARFDQLGYGPGVLKVGPAGPRPRTCSASGRGPEHSMSIATYGGTHRCAHSAWMHESNACHVLFSRSRRCIDAGSSWSTLVSYHTVPQFRLRSALRTDETSHREYGL